MPRASGASSLVSNSSWRPRQIPITGRPAVGDLAHRIAQAGDGEIAGALAEVAHARHQHPVRRAHLLGVGGERRLVAAGLERAHDAPQVVHAVVHHRDRHSVPLVDGTPATRGSMDVAASSARANALNAASTM